jgi:1-deoxy-D-xylulose-5-phosphate synthase
MNKLLSNINSPEDLKKLDFSSLKKLSDEIREFLINNILKTGGHLASNLGVVELTLALHRSFSVPKDKIIWDVGHQCYVHKMICGRKDKFGTLRMKGGLSGFPKPSENPCDLFCTGHCGTSLSVALGLACARDLSGDSEHVVAVIGDASLPNGLSMEALNHIIHSEKKVIIVLNDNQMSIGETKGALAKYLNKIRTNPKYYKVKRTSHAFLDNLPFIGSTAVKILRKSKKLLKFLAGPGILFESLGYKYLGPFDGHNIERLCTAFEEAKSTNAPVIVHVITTKGKGFVPAECAPSDYHAMPPVAPQNKITPKSASAVFGEAMVNLASKNPKLISISPSMPVSCGLKDFMVSFPDRFFDTGIAEAHAVTFAAGLASGGYTPVVSVYSTFLQRAYDSLIHDVALGNHHVVLAVDRAGIVGEDGETHQGIFDISYLSHMPKMSVLSPADNKELRDMLEFAVSDYNSPIAIRYPKGTLNDLRAPAFEFGKACILKGGTGVTIAAEGKMVHTAIKCAEILEKKNISAEIINIRTIKPLDAETILNSAKKTGLLFTIEDNVRSGGVGTMIAAELIRFECFSR